jgi:tetratricopeptide (TPR) repeat protein
MVAGALILSTSFAFGQHRIIQKDNVPLNLRVVEGEIIGATKATVEIKTANGSFGVQRVNIKEVIMPPPKAYEEGMEAYAAGDYKKALTLIGGLVNKFKGLPTPWAESATAALGDIYVGLNDLKKAEAAYKEISEYYPSAKKSTRAEVGMARLAIVNGNWDDAAKRLKPVTEAALKQVDVTPQDGAAYGQAFLLSGKIHEQKQNYSEALQDYLRTVTIYYHDTAATKEAAASARTLREQHKVVVP